MNLSPRKQLFVDAATELFGSGSTLSKKQIIEASQKAGVPVAGWFRKQYKVGYNQFKLPTSGEETAPTTIVSTPSETSSAVVNLVATNMERQNLVPSIIEGFVPWDIFQLLNRLSNLVCSILFLLLVYLVMVKH